MDLQAAAEQITRGLDGVGQRTSALPAARQESKPQALPTPQEREIARLVRQYGTEVEKTGKLIGRGAETLSEIYLTTTDAYTTSVLKAADRLSEIEDPALSRICTKFFSELTDLMGGGMADGFQIGKGCVEEIISRSLEPQIREPKTPEKPKTLTQVTTPRKLTAGERIRGYTLDVTWEED